MPTQTFPYLAISDGTTTVTLADGLGGLTSYPPVRGTWAPAVPLTRDSLIGGRLPYPDVVESIELNIRGADAATCLANLQTLNLLLDQAKRWWKRAENVSPVVIKYCPQGSTISSTATPLQSVILGPADGNETGATNLPIDFNDVGMYYEIRGIRLQFLRRGLWIGASESASAAAVANPAVLSVTMPSTPTVVGALEIDFTGFTTSAGTGTLEVPGGFVVIGPNNSLNMQQAEAGGPFLAAGATYVSTADAAARASGGSVGKLNHNLSAIGAESAISFTLPAAFLTSNKIGVFVTYRNNATIAWNLRASAFRSIGSLITGYTNYTTLPAVITNPTAVFLGEISSKYGFDTVMLRASIVSGSGTPTIDFDTILIVDLSTSYTFPIALGANQQLNLGAGFASKNASVIINHSPLTLRDPDVRTDILTTTAVVGTAYSGDVALVGAGSILNAIWYATHLYNGTTPYWTTQNNAGAAILNIGATITRRLGYLSPQ
jgi:hypothetical protein